MQQAWKSPTNLRLMKIEAWRKTRIEIAKRGHDQAKVFRAIHLFTAARTYLHGPRGMVSAYSDRD
jgi:hypothetical protein